MSEADQHLLQLIDAGDHDGWVQFVARFQKRLMAFASRQVDQNATAEDLVQETFVSFLTARHSFRGTCELESFLFQILRRRIVDHYRRQGTNREVPACVFGANPQTASGANPLQQAESLDMHASWYARQAEAIDHNQRTLETAVQQLATSLQKSENFRDLKIAEGLFYAGRRNRELAAVLQLSENEVALIKHRLLRRLRQFVEESGQQSPNADFEGAETASLLTSVWESLRPSCPKRTTLGKYTLGILPPHWDDFVRFHLETLGCSFCAANLAELQTPDETDEAFASRDRLFQSTVGFLKGRV